MNEDTRAAALEHARAEFPREACGLVIIFKGRERYWPCANLSTVGGDQFIMCPEDYGKAEEAGEVVGVFHSHVNLPPDPSEADKVSCEATNVPWYIVGIPTETWAQIEPCGYEAPLVGRVHCWNALDCWTLVHDWYRRERGIILMNVPRYREYWKDGKDILGGNAEAAGFVDVPEGKPLEAGDVILFQTGDSMVANHVALYIGDDQILHHAENRLSSRDVYGGWYKKHTVRVVRYAGDSAKR